MTVNLSLFDLLFEDGHLLWFGQTVPQAPVPLANRYEKKRRTGIKVINIQNVSLLQVIIPKQASNHRTTFP